MPNNDQNPNPQAAAQHALARAKSAREAVRAEAAEQKNIAAQKKERRVRCLTATVRRTFVIYTALNLLQFFAYLLVIYPIKGQPFSEMILGGISIVGHLSLLLAALIGAFVYSLILYRRPPKAHKPLTRYLNTVCRWYTILQFFMIALHGLYMDMLYNPYQVTDAKLFWGPSYLLSFACLGFALCIPIANRIFAIKRLPTAIRALAHLSVMLILATVFFYVLSHGFASSSDFLIFLVVFALVYAICIILYYSLRAAKERDDNEELAYTNLYMTDALRSQNQKDAEPSKTAGKSHSKNNP